MHGGRGALSKAEWGRREWGTARVLHLLPQLQSGLSLRDGVFTASGTLLYHLLMAGEKSYGKCLLVVHALCLLLSRQKSTDDQEMLFSTLQQ